MELEKQLREFHASISLYKHNHQILHWKVKGAEWDKTHTIMQDYYEKLEADLDLVGEMCLQCGFNPVSVIEAIDIAKESSERRLILGSSDDFFKDEVWEKSSYMFNHLLTLIERVKNNPGITGDTKSELEVLEAYYRLQAKYKLPRRMMK